MRSVLALPLALKDPLPNILRAVGGVEGKAWRRDALIGGLDGPLVQSAAATVRAEQVKLEKGGPGTAGRRHRCLIGPTKKPIKILTQA